MRLSSDQQRFVQNAQRISNLWQFCATMSLSPMIFWRNHIFPNTRVISNQETIFMVSFSCMPFHVVWSISKAMEINWHLIDCWRISTRYKKWFLEFTKLVTPRGKAWKMDWLLCLCTIWFKPIIRLKFEFWNQESNWCKYLLIYVMISIIHKFLFIIGQTYLTFPQA